MIIIHKLSLRIYGGAQNGALCEQPFVAVGDIPQEFVPKPPVLVDEQQVWMITHAQNYTLYTLSSKRCFTTDGQPGRILICLFLPPQKRLADGKSPLALLDSLMDCFMVQALRDGNLPTAPVDNAQFGSLLGECRLEERPMPLPIMQGHESASFCVGNRTQLDALMRHSRYPVLSTVGRLELGFDCESNVSLNTSGGHEKPKAKTPPPPPAAVVSPPPVEPKNPSKVAMILEPPTNPIPISKPKSSLTSSNVGGLSLDDFPIENKSKSGAKNGVKKVLKVLAIIVGAVFSLFVALLVIGYIASSNDSYKYDDDICVIDSVAPDVVDVFEETCVNDHLGEYLYTGPVDIDGMPHGIGEAKFSDGRIYHGPFVQGVFQGKDAKMRMPNGDLFEGSFANNEFEEGKYTSVESGNYFVGTFSNEHPYDGVVYDKNGGKIRQLKDGEEVDEEAAKKRIAEAEAKLKAEEEIRERATADASPKAPDEERPMADQVSGSYFEDGIEYKYEQPTQNQLLEWRQKYHSVCSGKIETKGFFVPQDMLRNHPCLVYLVLKSHSLKDDKEKQSWFDLYSLMNDEKVGRLYEILYRERYKMARINAINSEK